MRGHQRQVAARGAAESCRGFVWRRSTRGRARAKSIRLESNIEPHRPCRRRSRSRAADRVNCCRTRSSSRRTRNGPFVAAANRVEYRDLRGSTGVGIDPDFLPYVFERFRRARRHAAAVWRWAWIAIVRHLVELHGGTSLPRGGDGAGAIPVLLPMRVAPAIPSRRWSHPSAPWMPSRRASTMRVLVVDDEADARELFASIVERAAPPSSRRRRRMTHCESWPTETSNPAVRHRDARGGRLRADAQCSPPADPASIAIAVTAYARSVDRRRAIDAASTDHLAKPIEPRNSSPSSPR